MMSFTHIPPPLNNKNNNWLLGYSRIVVVRTTKMASLNLITGTSNHTTETALLLHHYILSLIPLVLVIVAAQTLGLCALCDWQY